MNYDQNAAEEILHLLSQKLQKETVFDSHPIFKLLASTQDSLAQELLAKQFEIAAAAEKFLFLLLLLLLLFFFLPIFGSKILNLT